MSEREPGGFPATNDPSGSSGESSGDPASVECLECGGPLGKPALPAESDTYPWTDSYQENPEFGWPGSD